jgi:hypothetical protein
MLPEGAVLIGEIIVEYMKRHGIGSIGGLELGAVAIVSVVEMRGIAALVQVIQSCSRNRRTAA